MYLLIPLRASRILNSLYAGQCGLVLLALFLASPPLWLHWLCTVWCLVAILRHITRERPTGLLLNDAEIQLSFNVRAVPVRLHRTCFCNPYLIVLRFAQVPEAGDCQNLIRKRRHFNVVLLPDSCPARLHRQLRTALGWYRFDERVLLP